MKKSQLRETIRTIVKSKLNKIKENNGITQSIMLNDLTVDKIKQIFPTFGERSRLLSFPEPNDSYTSVNDERSLEMWKNDTRNTYGNVEVMFFPEETMWYDKVKINDPKFISDKETYVKRKSNWLSREREIDRTGGLDENNSDYIKAMDIWKRVKRSPTMSSEERETYKQKLLQAAKNAGIKLDLN
jgi:hypothetical protein